MQSILIRSIVEIMLLISINWAWAQGNYSQTRDSKWSGWTLLRRILPFHLEC